MRYGSYDLISELGRGGMGVVHKAQHAVLGTPACVKLLLSEWTQNAEIVQRFVNEARAAAGLSHDNIVGVIDCNQGPDGLWFIVLEYLDGVPLSKWIRGGQGRGVTPRTEAGGVSCAVAPTQVARVLVQAASALHAAHEHASGIVHRDVKPDNMFLVARKIGGRDNDLHVVLLDFGIAKLRDAHASELTRTGVAIGTPSYMAPEQLANAKVVDRRADVYALGVVLYEMLTGGWLPWSDENNETPAPTEIYRRQTAEPPPDPRMRNPNVSALLAEVVRRALACDPRERWTSALEFARALAEAVPADGNSPSGAEILRRYAEELWDPADPMFGHRLRLPATSVPDGSLWTPPVSAVSIAASHGGAGQVAATRSLRPPPPGAPTTTLGASAAQSVPSAVGAGRVSRRALYGVLGVVGTAGAVVIAAIVLSSSGGGEPSRSSSGSAAGGGPAPGLVDAAAAAMTSVAILTEPAGAAVFVDDDLVGTAPTKVTLAAGRTVRVRAELAGHALAEETHVVADRTETLRLPLVALVDAVAPVDGGVDAARVSKPGGRPRAGPDSDKPGGPGPAATPGSGAASGSGSAKFDPENIAE